MDEIDKKQQEQIDALSQKAEANKTVDKLQWVTIIAVGFALVLYFNFGLITIATSQADNVKKILEHCHQ